MSSLQSQSMADPTAASPGRIRFIVQTPHGCVLDEQVCSLRVRTSTGHVGLRPRNEPSLLAIEPGLVLARSDVNHFVASVGGLVRCDRDSARMLTPLAVVGTDRGKVSQQLEAALSLPGSDLELRRILRRLEAGILGEMRDGRAAPPRRGT